jgi:DNA-binding transcriptional LysR family regulator
LPIYEVRLVLAVPDDHPWRADPAVEVIRLRDRPLVASQRGAFSRRALDAACRRAGFEPLVAFDSASPNSVVALGAAGLGIPITIDDALPTPYRRPWPLLVENGEPVGDIVKLTWRAGASLTPTVQAFVDLARAAVAQRQVATSV